MKTYVFGECAICGQGHLLAFRSGDTGDLLVMCDDCESQWRNPAEARSFENAIPDVAGKVTLASTQDAEEAGWASLATGVMEN